MKIVKIILALIVLCSFLLLCDIFYFPISYDKLDFIQKLIINETNKKWDMEIKNIPLESQSLIGEDKLINSLNFIEKGFVNRVLKINPKELGSNGPFFSKEVPNDLIAVSDKEIKLGNVEVGISFLPQLVFDDFVEMNKQMKDDIGKELYIESGYRSPGYQAYFFFYYLPENGYSLKENAKWLTLPGYSEHNSANTALDFINQDGISGEAENQTAEDFVGLQEYKWLESNANKYNFYLSYPPDNPYGISFEPWHWRWEK